MLHERYAPSEPTEPVAPAGPAPGADAACADQAREQARAALEALVARVRAEAAAADGKASALDPLSADYLSLPEPALPELGYAGADGVLHPVHLLSIPRAEFVGQAYRLLLGREPDEAGAAHYAAVLALTGSRLWVVAQLRGSAEGRRRGVRLAGGAGLLARYLAARVAVRLGLGGPARRAFGRYEQRLASREAAGIWLADALQRQRDGMLRAQRAWRKPIEAVAGSVLNALREQRDARARLDVLEDQLDKLSAELTHERLSRMGERRTAPPVPGLLPHHGGGDNVHGEAAPGADLRAQIEAYYMAFENANRGSREEIRRKLSAYDDWIEALRKAAPGPVLDIGCGRGEWLELLAERGIPARGVDLNSTMVAFCRGRGLEVDACDGVEAMARMPAAALGAVTAFHVVEHLPFEVLYAMIANAARVLAPGGSILIETPNPENLLVGSHTFYHDFSHRNPVTPTSLSFLLAFHGFEAPQVLRLNPYPAAAKVPGDDPLTERVNGHLCGPQDYAMIARKPLLPKATPAPPHEAAAP
ncbi:methyltransferase domain-containing protein [Cupriavidus taiwanensis]|uniref:methyltransferase domain-containing protein n=1 Tax=Cupriavidus taiwanensis TaxID=164546 RepID=UPI000E1013D7|nr:methyltransferase domain-containing protein [Cupriavidus taiwanensis]SPA57070.1 putative methyltransferase [Cupriavidus taiwanensis]